MCLFVLRSHTTGREDGTEQNQPESLQALYRSAVETCLLSAVASTGCAGTSLYSRFVLNVSYPVAAFLLTFASVKAFRRNVITTDQSPGEIT